MIKDELINIISQETYIARHRVASVLESMMKNITDTLARGEKVQLSGFGTFEPKKRNARTGRNPHTGEAVPIPARIMPVFTAGRNLKTAVEKEIGEDIKPQFDTKKEAI